MTFRQKALEDFNISGKILVETSSKHFGHPHTGQINRYEFEKDFRNSLPTSQQHNFLINFDAQNSSDAIKTWKPSIENLNSFLARTNNTTNVNNYIKKLYQRIENIVQSKVSLQDENLDKLMTSLINEILESVNKIESEVISDSKLTDQEVFSILTATCAVQ